MVSRRKILSRSRDDLMNMSDYQTTATAATADDEDDVWYNKDKLYRDHMQEVLEKWTQIDDEIWAKVICFERNRRVAKAYARAPVLTINGSDDGFDGYRIGLLGFDNPMRDSKTEEVKRHVGHGVKIKMDDAGNILVKRVSKANVYVKDIGAGQDNNDNSISVDALRLQNGALEVDKPVKLFDMEKFQRNVNRELKRAYPDRRKLEFQCISAVAFVKNEADILDCPCWVIVINIVAMDMLKSKLPPVQRKPLRDEFGPRGRVPVDEDPYSVPGQPGGGSATSSSSRDKRMDRPPKLPPRDTGMSRYQIPKPDYEEQQLQQQQQQQQHADENKYRIPHLQSTSRKTAKTFPDDPYYCGMKAHTPNFAGKGKSSANGAPPSTVVAATESPYAKTWLMGPYGPTANHMMHRQPAPAMRAQPAVLRPPPEPIYDTRIGAECLYGYHGYSYVGGANGGGGSGGAKNGNSSAEDHYSHIYGRVSLPRFVNSFRPRTVYVGEWE